MSASETTSTVITLDSAKAYERPIGVVHEGTRYDITEIEDRWISTGVDPTSPVVSGFQVRCRGGSRFKLEHSKQFGWRITELPSIKIVSHPG